MRSSITVTSAPAAEPVTTTEAKTYLRVDGSDEDALIAQFITAARQWVEQHLRRALITQTLKLTLDRFPLQNTRSPWWDGVRDGAISDLYASSRTIVLPRPPLQSISSIVAYDESNTSHTMSSSLYTADTAGARVLLNDGASWPTSLRNRNAVEVTYVAGYGSSSSSIPQSIVIGVLQVVRDLYHNRDCSDMSDATKALLSPYKVMDGIAYACL